MKKKTLKYNFAVLLIIGCLFSCTNIDEKVYSSIPAEQFFTNEREVIMNMGRAYAHLRGATAQHWGLIGLLTVTSDEAIIPFRETNLWWDGGVWIDLHKHNFTANLSVIGDVWSYCFNGISTCNQIIYQIEESPVEFDSKPNLIAEMKILRAYFYFNALDWFGNVPITTDFQDVSLPVQSTRKEVFDFVEKEIKDNITLLDPYTTQENYGRATQAMGYIMLAKLYLNAQEWTGATKWQEAIDACDAILNAGHFNLESNYFANFTPNNETSQENIFVVPYDRTNTRGWYNNFLMHCLTLHTLSQQTFNLVAFTWDGICATESFYNSFDDTDKRKNMWLEGPQYSSSGEPLMISPGRQLTYRPKVNSLNDESNIALLDDGVRFQKYAYEPGILDDESMSNDWVIYRFADVKLIKAEAIMRKSGNVATQEAVDLVNEVRARAFGNSDNDFTTATLTMNELLAELGREFAWEHHRRQDLIRFDQWTKAWFEKSAGGDHLKLFPIPAWALDVNINLKQNAGY